MAGEIPGHHPKDRTYMEDGERILEFSSTERFRREVAGAPLSAFTLGDLPVLIRAMTDVLTRKQHADLVRQRIAEFNARQNGQVPPTGDNPSEGGK